MPGRDAGPGAGGDAGGNGGRSRCVMAASSHGPFVVARGRLRAEAGDDVAGMVRAGLCQQTLATIRALDEPGLALRVLGRVPRDVVQRVTTTQRTEWLPVADEVALLEALYAEIGSVRHRSVWSAAMEKHLLKVAASMRGQSPNGLLKLVPQAFLSMFRDAGRLDVVVNDAGRGRVVYRERAESPALLESIAATLDAGIRCAGRTGATTIFHDEDGVAFALRWS